MYMPINVHPLEIAKKNEWQLSYALRQSNECPLQYKNQSMTNISQYALISITIKAKDKDNIIFVIIYSFVVYRWTSHRKKNII